MKLVNLRYYETSDLQQTPLYTICNIVFMWEQCKLSWYNRYAFKSSFNEMKTLILAKSLIFASRHSEVQSYLLSKFHCISYVLNKGIA